MADKPDKTNKLKARLPRGFADRGGAEIAAARRMLDKIRAVYERYGFEPLETPAMEYTDALGKFLPDQDRPNEGVFSFQDDDEQWLSLRYDLTAPLARYVAENFEQLPKPYRSYREGWVFRNEKPGPGRFRQFMQFDADTVGSAAMAADAEMCMMAADTMEALGIPRGSYVVKVNNRKVLDGVLESINLGGEANAGKRLTVMRAIAKLLKTSGYDDGRIVIDPSVVRGLEYYTGPVYEAELLLETKDEKGRPVRFGSVGGGGRYDGLVSRFRNEPVPATGFSVGVSRLLAALVHLK